LNIAGSFLAKLVDVGSIACYFESLADPRHTRNRKHLLVDIAVIAVAAIICGCDGPTAIHRWATHSADWLAQYLALPNGIPSRDCIRRLLIALKPETFQRCFRAWLADGIAADDRSDKRIVAIDGKTCRSSHDAKNDLGALHIVSAWASEEGIALGQVATDAKSNEITAIPQLLEQLNLANTIVTIDAMGCQKAIIEIIVAGQGDFVIAVKDNQPKLKAAIETFFDQQIERDFEELRYRTHETRDEAHGRVDERAYYLTKTPRDFEPADDWPEVKAIGYAIVSRNMLTVVRPAKPAITSVAVISAANASPRPCAATGGSNRCIGPWMSRFARTTVAPANGLWATISVGCAASPSRFSNVTR
jgi:predicted transposase YbfD/YdcC